MRNWHMLLSLMLKHYRNNKFADNVWSANWFLFISVSIHCVETVKKLDNNQFFQLARWSTGSTYDWGESSIPGFSKVLCLNLYFFSVVVLLCCQNTVFVTQFCNVNWFNTY